MNKIVRKHSDLMECREASAQHIERKLNKLLFFIKKRPYPSNKPTPEETFQIAQLKAEVKKWRDESQRHAFQVALKDEVIEVK